MTVSKYKLVQNTFCFIYLLICLLYLFCIYENILSSKPFCFSFMYLTYCCCCIVCIRKTGKLSHVFIGVIQSPNRCYSTCYHLYQHWTIKMSDLLIYLNGFWQKIIGSDDLLISLKGFSVMKIKINWCVTLTLTLTIFVLDFNLPFHTIIFRSYSNYLQLDLQTHTHKNSTNI